MLVMVMTVALKLNLLVIDGVGFVLRGEESSIVWLQ